MKVFLSDIEGLLDQSTIAELLDLSKQPKHLLYAYREIRQEVAFLSTLEHANLTQLCGVRTNPYMCLLLELAPKKSLRAMLKEYRDADVVLEPLTLKNTTMQVCAMLVPSTASVFLQTWLGTTVLFQLRHEKQTSFTLACTFIARSTIVHSIYTHSNDFICRHIEHAMAFSHKGILSILEQLAVKSQHSHQR